MAKSGWKKGKGMLQDGASVDPEELKQQMKEQASQLVQAGYVAKMDFQSDTPKGRPYVLISVMDSVVKKYLTDKDIPHYNPDQIHYEKALTLKDKKKLGKDFKMPKLD